MIPSDLHLLKLILAVARERLGGSWSWSPEREEVFGGTQVDIPGLAKAVGTEKRQQVHGMFERAAQYYRVTARM